MTATAPAQLRLDAGGSSPALLEVECLEAELRDIGPRREAEACLGHDAPPTPARR